MQIQVVCAASGQADRSGRLVRPGHPGLPCVAGGLSSFGLRLAALRRLRFCLNASARRATFSGSFGVWDISCSFSRLNGLFIWEGIS
jgi:hypothetical protein